MSRPRARYSNCDQTPLQQLGRRDAEQRRQLGRDRRGVLHQGGVGVDVAGLDRLREHRAGAVEDAAARRREDDRGEAAVPLPQKLLLVLR
jgi:hypothetical protein